jgi:hypothetical protein
VLCVIAVVVVVVVVYVCVSKVAPTKRAMNIISGTGSGAEVR